jgi:putative transposase
VSLMCRILDVSRAGYYAWRDRPAASTRDRRRAELTGRIRVAYEASRRTYGSPRLAVELKAQDVSVSENTVAKYMRQAGLRVSPRRRFVPRTTDPRHSHPIAPNTLARDFAADAPDRKWVCDITCVWTDEGWLYVSIVIDLYSRKVVGWSMHEDLKTAGVAEALDAAIASRHPAPGLLHHSDRGCQYAGAAYRTLLADHGIERSMSRPGNCYDNAVAESFFSTFKTELVHRTHYRTKEEARLSIFEWIECWYNPRRRHSSLGYLSPEAFEAQAN